MATISSSAVADASRRWVLATALRTLAVARPELAARLAGSRLSARVAGEGTVVAKRLGKSLTINLADNVQRKLFLTGAYEPRFLDFLRDELRQDDVYVDIGGHIGIDAIVAARRLRELGGGLVYAFEPAPDSAAHIRDAVAEFGNATVVQCALGAQGAEAELRSDMTFGVKDAATRSLFGDGEVIARVPVRRFDDWASEESISRIDVVKIDVEGSEYDVITGMRGSLIDLRPRVVIVEIDDQRVAQARHHRTDLTDLLERFGYSWAGETLLRNAVFRRTDAPGAPESHMGR